MKLINRPWKKILLLIVYVLIVSPGVVIWSKTRPVMSPTVPTNPETVNIDEDAFPNKTTINKPVITKPVVQLFDKTKYSTSDPSSLWLVANKQHPLTPINYIPSNLVNTVGATISSIAQPDFDAMNNAALAAGVNFTIVSSYRSYSSQSIIYNNYVASYGIASTDTFSARPGYSEHQTGFTVDLGSSTSTTCNLDTCFNTTVEGQWLASNAANYGFILRYPADKQQITGYKYEPWHYRYVGKELAIEMKDKSIATLEEFFNISGGEVYI